MWCLERWWFAALTEIFWTKVLAIACSKSAEPGCLSLLTSPWIIQSSSNPGIATAYARHRTSTKRHQWNSWKGHLWLTQKMQGVYQPGIVREYSPKSLSVRERRVSQTDMRISPRTSTKLCQKTWEPWEPSLKLVHCSVPSHIIPCYFQASWN